MISPHTFSNITDWLENSINSNKLPFGKITVSQNNNIIFSEFREKNLDDYADNNLYRIQSLTKPVTSIVALIILEKFGIDINEPIKSIINDFSNLKVLSEGKLENANNDITFEHLLTHTSGLTYGFNYSNKSILRGNTDADEIYRKTGLLGKIQNSSITSDEFIEIISSLPLAYHPGSRWNYGFSTDLLGVLLEKICNKSLNDIFRDELFIHLDMNDTFFPDEYTENLIPTFKLTIPSGFKLISGSDSVKNPKYFSSGGGGLISSPEDYHKFCNFILDPNYELLQITHIDKLKTNQLSGDLNYLSDGMNFFDFTFAGPGMGFTYGFSIIDNPDLLNYKSTSQILSWAGSSNTIVWIDQKNNFVFSMFSQLIPFGYYSYKKELMNLIYSDSNFI